MIAIGLAPSQGQQEIVSGAGFSRAVRALLPALRRHAQHLTHNPAASDDLVQETLASAWKARERFEPGSNLKAWLFRILRNRFLTDLRRTRREIAWDADIHESALFGEADQEEQLMLDDLKCATTRLPDGYADALRLILRDGLSYEEAAERLGVARGTVASQIHRARKMLLHEVLGTARPARSEPPSPMAAASSEAAPPRTIYARWKQSGSRMIG